jgi:hypothetical protein
VETKMSKRNSIERYKEDKNILLSKSRIKFEKLNEIKIPDAMPPYQNQIVSI